MKLGVIIPDRGDRPELMENCLRMIKGQTFPPHQILQINYHPESDQCDITQRYRRGYDAMRGQDLDIIAFIENDDWYHAKYFEYMVRKWEENGKPDLFGNNYTIYYHLKLRRYFKFQHIQRASAMNTFIKPDLTLTWPRDHDPYTDQWLWVTQNIKSKISIEPEFIVSVGMKHGIGKTGGAFHNHEDPREIRRYINEDRGFLQNTLDKDSYDFYSGLVF